MKRYFSLLFVIAFFSLTASAQVTLETCQEKAKNNYPLIRQYGLIEQSKQFSLENAGKAYLPQINFAARATYQSDVTEIPPTLGPALSKITGQNVNFQSVNKDQYQLTAEVSQMLWDGGAVKSQKEIIKANGEVEKQKLEVDLFTLKERVNQLFFGILALNQQISQLEVLQKELQTNYNKVKAFMQNGIANQSDLDVIKVEQLKAVQQNASLAAVRKSYLQMLAHITGDATIINQTLVKPQPQLLSSADLSVNRPELKLFEAQNNLLANRESLVKSSYMPKAGLFVQGGYGNPGLNMFKSGFTPYYIAGARVTWNLGGLYTQKNDIQKIKLDQQNIDIQKETFLYNINLKLLQENNEIEKIREQLKSDDEIITLRQSIKKSAEVKAANGTLSVSDLIREINAENSAVLEKSLHEIQLLMAVYNLKNTINN